MQNGQDQGRRMEKYETAKVAYRWLRRAIGGMGVALPFLVWGVHSAQVLNAVPLPSISDYYHTEVQYIFVTVLAAVAILLFAYPGYDRDDDLAGTLAGVFAAGVVLCPTRLDADTRAAVKVLSVLHFIFAALMFGTLAVFCLVLFRRTVADRKPPALASDMGARVRSMLQRQDVQVGGKKKQRNDVYWLCGWMIVACMVGAALYKLAEHFLPSLSRWQGVFVFESLALLAFGFAWMVKGEAVLADSVDSITSAPDTAAQS